VIRPHFRHRLIFIALASGLVLAPLAFGGSTDWFTAVFAVTVGALAIAWSATALIAPNQSQIRVRPIALPVVLFCVAVLWCFVQATFPISETLAHPAWNDAGHLLGEPVSLVLSVNPEASLAGAMRLTGYGFVFLLCYQFAGDEPRAIRLLALIAAAGAIYSIYGVALELSGSGFVLWYERAFEVGNLSSTFPNRNAFASYATLCLLSGFMLLYRRSIRHDDRTKGRQQLIAAVAGHYFRRNGWLLYACTALFVAILLTHSRAGLITALIAFLVFAVSATFGARHRSATIAGCLFIGISAATLFAVTGGPTIKRFDKIEAATIERVEIYRLTAQAISDRPLLGTGLGTFSDVFPAYRSATLRPRIDFAHDSYLENALEMGVPAAFVFYGSFAMLLSLFIRALVSRRGIPAYPALGIAVLMAACFHSLFDYAIQFPAVAISLAAVLGIAAAQSVGAPRSTKTVTAHTERRM
jgi:O-antigen ligase